MEFGKERVLAHVFSRTYVRFFAVCAFWHTSEDLRGQQPNFISHGNLAIFFNISINNH